MLHRLPIFCLIVFFFYKPQFDENQFKSGTVTVGHTIRKVEKLGMKEVDFYTLIIMDRVRHNLTRLFFDTISFRTDGSRSDCKCHETSRGRDRTGRSPESLYLWSRTSG